MSELDDLKRDVQYLKDRSAILDVINSHARGCDRHDVDRITAAYHADGVDEHGNTINAGPEYAAWANAVHDGTAIVNQHNITTHTCEIDGDTAHAESYVIVVLLFKDRATAQLMVGRYLDRLEKRDGTWRIAVRRATVEAAITGDASSLTSPYFTRQGYWPGTHDRTDPSYARPLTLDTPAPLAW